ncbi:ATP-binding protein [Ferroplasma sp.]|uniref:ATP-binding protein n=1 Tax=Ferroplasma sp. TaxID=2591003 RepID=UPI00260219A5|nr:ATP-binding protein [Ferroplasma sp.]
MNKPDVVGVFIGLESATYEYIATIISPYNINFTLNIGDFLLIENLNHEIVSRVTEYRPTGELTSFMGQKWLGDISNDLDAIGLDIKEKKIRYNVRIKILGTLKEKEFTPGLTKIPHITSKVYKPDYEQLKNIIDAANKDQINGTEIGKLWIDKSIGIKFNVSDLNSRRSFIFARAGYGKSNLMKLIASSWPKGEGGLIIFDPEGEYAIIDKNNRHGIMDAKPALLITNRKENPELKNVYRTMKLNFKTLEPQFIIPLIINPMKYETIFYQKLMSMEKSQWEQLVDLIQNKKWSADLPEVAKIITRNEDDDGQSLKPVLNNLVAPIMKLHDPDSHLIDIITKAMKTENVVIVDISLLDNQTALQLSSLILQFIFNHNQTHFTDENTDLIKATFVMEEAQSVIGQNTNYSTFVELAKEGRKYNLGGIFITQQPGSIPQDILSQGDNFFIFHLLSRGDLESLKRSNAHFSDDILTQILSEPTPGKCYMWTSHQPFVLPVMIDDFDIIGASNNSINIQAKENLLDPILTEVRKDDETISEIIKLQQEVEKENPEDEKGNKTKKLFNKLTNEQKEYLRKNGQIQSNNVGMEFAVKTKFYNNLLK